ncbi:hypothetical protein [Chengkuizengella axinellae]|uniref:ATP-grasp domain-containing protein n=1 Tax=Chengkuizengella axinellae TaxID=3064388 RepID=A0ABT9IXY2_9BACL|nr:hypothetical protein [Chengkuizengella sp. 2205SS18-9]MDP5274224.1 hypothetical protein [Chengkuizengella sp. 2205SS18-9]
MKIEIITTPNENLKETGFGTIEACEAILETLQKRFGNVKLNICENESDLTLVTMRQPDLVILAVKYIQLENEEKLWLSNFFEKSNLNFTGSIREVLNFDSNKIEAKKQIESEGIKTAAYFLVTPETYQLEADIPIDFPIFLKPMNAANGNGIDEDSLVYNFLDYKKKTESIFLKYNKIVLAEKYLSGREFTVAIIQNQNNELIVSPIEIIPPKNKNGVRILGSEVKTGDTEELREIVDINIKNKLNNIAMDTFNFLGARDYGRIDIKMDEYGECYFLEINLVPGMKKGSSYFPKAFEIGKKWGYEKVIDLIVNNALQRTLVSN